MKIGDKVKIYDNEKVVDGIFRGWYRHKLTDEIQAANIELNDGSGKLILCNPIQRDPFISTKLDIGLDELLLVD